MLNLTQLKYFEITAKAGSFAKACEIANITQPALSNAIKALETRLGFKLFDRNERPIKLTARGRSLLRDVDRLLFHATNVETGLDALRDGEGGHVRLGMTAAFASAFGGKVAARWHKANPMMTLDVLVRPTPILVEKLLTEDMDIIVGITGALQSSAAALDTISLSKQKGRAFVRTDHPLVRKPNLSTSDVQTYGLAASHYAPSVLQQFANRFGFDRIDDLPLVVDSENTTLLCDLTARTDLILISTRQSAQQSIALGALVELNIDLNTTAHWAVAKRKGRKQLPGGDALIEVIRTVLSETKED